MEYFSKFIRTGTQQQPKSEYDRVQEFHESWQTIKVKYCPTQIYSSFTVFDAEHTTTSWRETVDKGNSFHRRSCPFEDLGWFISMGVNSCRRRVRFSLHVKLTTVRIYYDSQDHWSMSWISFEKWYVLGFLFLPLNYLAASRRSWKSCPSKWDRPSVWNSSTGTSLGRKPRCATWRAISRTFRRP